MKKKIMIVLVVVLVIFLIIEFVYLSKPDSINTTNNSEITRQDDINDQGEYEFTNSSYIIGQDIPVGKYKLVTKSDNAKIDIVSDQGSIDISDTNVGEEIILKDSDSALIVSDGTITLK